VKEFSLLSESSIIFLKLLKSLQAPYSSTFI